jgi:hypothetical protein
MAATNGFLPDARHELRVDVGTDSEGARTVDVTAADVGSRHFSAVLLGSDVRISSRSRARFLPPEASGICVLVVRRSHRIPFAMLLCHAAACATGSASR